MRTVGVTLIAFYKEGNDIYILAEKRADTISLGGLWCLPCGHLEYNETGEEAAVRETLEETGILFPRDQIKLFNVDTDPTIYNQHVILRYIVEATSKKNSFSIDKNEVEQVKWINLKDINAYPWAFNHDKLLNNLKI